MIYKKTWKTNHELEKAIATYVEFYNNHRIKVGLYGISIADYQMVAVA